MTATSFTGWLAGRLCLAVGLAQGLLGMVLVSLEVETPAMAAAVAGVTAAVLALGLGLQQVWPAARPTAALRWLVLLATLMAGCAAWVCGDLGLAGTPDFGRDTRLPSLFCWGVGALWCGVALAGAAGEAQADAGSRLDWLRTTLHQSLAALAVVGVVYLVLVAGVALLDLVGLDLGDIVYSKRGTALLVPLAWGLGMHGVRGRAAGGFDLASLSGLTGRMDARLSRALLPVMAGLVGIFLVGLAVQGLGPLWGTRAATSILLGMQGLVVAAAMLAAPSHADGEETASTPSIAPIIRHGTDLLLLVLPILTLLSLQALWLRIHQYGLTPERIQALVLCLLAVLAAAGLCAVVVRARLKRRPWLEGAPVVAWVVALVLVASAVLLHTPWLDPLALSARSQSARLVSGKAANAEQILDTMWWRLGTPGRAGATAFVDGLAELEGQGVYTAEAAARLRDALQSIRIRQGDKTLALPEITPEAIVVLPEGTQAPPEVREVAAALFRLGNAPGRGEVVVTPLQADAEAGLEWLVIAPQDYHPLQLLDLVAAGNRTASGPGWVRVGEYPASSPRATLLDLARSGGWNATAPRYFELHLGQRQLSLDP